MNVQISFAKDANLEVVKEQAQEVIAECNENDEFWCAFLNRNMCIEKGFNTEIVNLLDEVFGTRLNYVANRYNTFAEYMGDIQVARQLVSDICDKTYVLDSRINDGLKAEVLLASRHRVVMK